MAMNWIKGLVAPPANFTNPAQQGGGPPVGGGAMPDTVPGTGAMQWSQGTRTQAQAQGLATGSVSDPRDAQKIEALRRDVESLALFARTLLTMLEENKVITRAQFETTKNRLDAMDGKIDDR
jgi:hypothetical protein